MAAKKYLQLKIIKTKGKVVMRLNGYLDGGGACQVEHELQQLREKARGCKLIFDLGGVRNFEYFGIAIMAKSIRRQRTHFQEVSLTGLHESNENVFRRFGLRKNTVF